MAYTLADLLERLCAIGETSVKLFEDIANNTSQIDKRISTVARVLKSDEMRHVQHCLNLLKESKVHEGTEIPFDIYDKAYSLINEFKNRIYVPNIASVQELIIFSYEHEMSMVALLLDIRGRMVKNSSDVANYNYIAMTQMILDEQTHAAAISAFIK
jgi:hypothetical protein